MNGQCHTVRVGHRHAVSTRTWSDRVAHILVTLLHHALTACDPDGQVPISAYGDTGPWPHAIAPVTDDGIGIARAHDGDVSASSPGLGKGARFTQRLPKASAT